MLYILVEDAFEYSVLGAFNTKSEARSFAMDYIRRTYVDWEIVKYDDGDEEKPFCFAIDDSTYIKGYKTKILCN